MRDVKASGPDDGQRGSAVPPPAPRSVWSTAASPSSPPSGRSSAPGPSDKAPTSDDAPSPAWRPGSAPAPPPERDEAQWVPPPPPATAFGEISEGGARTRAAIIRPTRGAQVDQVWQAARRWTAAVVVALFPVLFILDDLYDWRLSPVIPGLAALVLVMLLLPFLLCELWQRRVARRDPDGTHGRAGRLARSGQIALRVALGLFVAWLAVGL